MIIKNSALAAVAVRKDQYPPDDHKEIAFAGRSNVGKSSLLNLLTGRRNLAKVSGNPGKTRTINFYNVTAKPAIIGGSGVGSESELAFRIVDLPGYGYAKVSKSLSENWGDMIEAYLKSRNGLVCTVLLLDIRHNPTTQDIQMYEWLQYYGLSGLFAATKADKVSTSDESNSVKRIKETLSLGEEDKVFPVSVLKKTGVNALLAEIERRIQSG